MADSTFWWLGAGVLVAAELLSGSFYLLMLALGLAAGAFAAQLGLMATAQVILAALVGSAAVLGCYLLRRRLAVGTPGVQANPDVNPDIGQIVHIGAWDEDGLARVKYRGALWTASTPDFKNAGQPGHHRIVEVRGSQLLVERIDDDRPADPH
ncbi:NfeD family protein [Hylemonella gracilis]|uniref:NfeD family protein n=1 Tax=Hylemonella gracilis TaxID=80880 RepID=A0A4P6ULM7_9BURK|nr:NfeD family protein [Hylemonella gracilis]QBK05464.1 NfeD family protein [Hylemonella gracilis]